MKGPFFTQSALINSLSGILHAFGGKGFHVKKPLELNRAMDPVRIVGIPPHRILFLDQVHSGEVITFREPLLQRRGKIMGDAVLCLNRGEGAAILTADCYPVIAASNCSTGFVAIHAGWRGLVEGVLENGILALSGELSLPLNSLNVAVGPGVSPCCYEVGKEVAERFSHFPCVKQDSEGRYFLDLAKVIHEKLLALGINPDSIDVLGHCTICNDDFYSIRRERGTSERQISVAYLF